MTFFALALTGGLPVLALITIVDIVMSWEPRVELAMTRAASQRELDALTDAAPEAERTPERRARAWHGN